MNENNCFPFSAFLVRKLHVHFVPSVSLVIFLSGKQLNFNSVDQIIVLNRSTYADLYLRRTICVSSNQLSIGLNVSIIKNCITSVNYLNALVLIIIIFFNC